MLLHHKVKDSVRLHASCTYLKITNKKYTQGFPLLCFFLFFFQSLVFKPGRLIFDKCLGLTELSRSLDLGENLIKEVRLDIGVFTPQKYLYSTFSKLFAVYCFSIS